MKIAILGTGKAAQRIYSILNKINSKNEISFYSNSRSKIFIKGKKIFTKKSKIKNIIENIVFIANNTNKHFYYAFELMKLNKSIYVEKPICTNTKETKLLEKIFQKFKKNITIGYQLRENKSLNYVKKIIKKNYSKIVSVIAVSGENVKKYHPDEDYKKSYSVLKKKGGGVLLTQSHEIDFLNEVFGPFKTIKAISNNNTSKFNLKSNAENNVSFILNSKDNFSVIANLNYYSYKNNQITVQFTDKILYWSLEDQSVKLIGKRKIYKKFKQTRENMFNKSITKFLNTLKTKPTLKKFKNQLEVVKIINQIKRASNEVK